MRSAQEIDLDAIDRRAFSNGSSFEIWSYNWCDDCKVDAPYRRDEVDEGCPLLFVLLMGKTPVEFKEVGLQDYECPEFVPDDDGDDDDGAPTPPAPTGPAVEIEGQQDILGVWAQRAIDRASREVQVHV